MKLNDINKDFLDYIYSILKDDIMSKDNNVDSITLSKIFSVSQRRIQQLSKDKIIPKNGSNQYPLMPAIMAYIQYLQTLTNGKKINPEDYEVEKINKLKIESKLLQLELQKKQESLLEYDDVRDGLHKMMSEFRELLLAIPPRIAPKLMNIKKEEQIRELIEKALHESMNVMANHDPKQKTD